MRNQNRRNIYICWGGDRNVLCKIILSTDGPIKIQRFHTLLCATIMKCHNLIAYRESEQLGAIENNILWLLEKKHMPLVSSLATQKRGLDHEEQLLCGEKPTSAKRYLTWKRKFDIYRDQYFRLNPLNKVEIVFHRGFPVILLQSTLHNVTMLENEITQAARDSRIQILKHRESELVDVC
jgi:hypothetical protein